MIMISNFLSNTRYFYVVICFFSQTTNIRYLFSTAVNTELVAKPITLGILPSTSVILALKSVFLAKPLTSGIFLSTPVIFFSKSDPSFSYLSLK